MSAYANSLQKPQRFDMYVRKLQSICVMHGVHIGSHRDLPDFLEQLVEDKHLAMDFWAFIGRLSHREGGELTDDQTLAVVIESITDSDVWQEDAGLSRTIDRLRALLAGVDIHAGEQAEPKIAPFPRDKGAPPNDPSLWTHDDASSLRPPDSEAVFPHGQVDENPDPIAAPSATHAPRLEEELLRIELTRLLRQYFDDVAKKMSKGEPHHESATSMGTIASAMTRRSAPQAYLKACFGTTVLHRGHPRGPGSHPARPHSKEEGTSTRRIWTQCWNPFTGGMANWSSLRHLSLP
jgi:hypothetical protein